MHSRIVKLLAVATVVAVVVLGTHAYQEPRRTDAVDRWIDAMDRAEAVTIRMGDGSIVEVHQPANLADHYPAIAAADAE